MKTENVWAWLMPSGKIYRVLTNKEEGTIKVFDPKGDLKRKEENLAQEAVEAIEKNFLGIVAKKMSGEEKAVMDEIAMYIR